MCVNESFLGFAEASSTTGEELATTIMTKLRKYGIVTQAMKGQGYDGAANMAGKQRNLLCGRNISGLICNYTEAIS
jgi:hypothetical protein